MANAGSLVDEKQSKTRVEGELYRIVELEKTPRGIKLQALINGIEYSGKGYGSFRL